MTDFLREIRMIILKFGVFLKPETDPWYGKRSPGWQQSKHSHVDFHHSSQNKYQFRESNHTKNRIIVCLKFHLIRANVIAEIIAWFILGTHAVYVLFIFLSFSFVGVSNWLQLCSSSSACKLLGNTSNWLNTQSKQHQHRKKIGLTKVFISFSSSNRCHLPRFERSFYFLKILLFVCESTFTYMHASDDNKLIFSSFSSSSR